MNFSIFLMITGLSGIAVFTLLAILLDRPLRRHYKPHERKVLECLFFVCGAALCILLPIVLFEVNATPADSKTYEIVGQITNSGSNSWECDYRTDDETIEHIRVIHVKIDTTGGAAIPAIYVERKAWGPIYDDQFWLILPGKFGT